MATRSIYRGFSTQKSLETRGRTFSTSDVETVKADLMNHIFTIIEDDLREVFTYDPRVKLLALAVLALPDNNAIVAVIDIQYLELGTFDTLKLEFPTGS